MVCSGQSHERLQRALRCLGRAFQWEWDDELVSSVRPIVRFGCLGRSCYGSVPRERKLATGTLWTAHGA